jgi:hypothetical protein
MVALFCLILSSLPHRGHATLRSHWRVCLAEVESIPLMAKLGYRLAAHCPDAAIYCIDLEKSA